MDVYSPEIGERLIQYCEVELKVCASRVTRARVIVRKLNRLNQGLDDGKLYGEIVDFTNSRIRFLQQKTDDPWESELFPEVKDALLDYIQNVRPEVRGCSRIFMTLVIPYQPMDCFAINTMVWTQFGKSGVPIAKRRHGSRAFRSSMASNMINDNVSTEIVRRVLGHGTKHAIKHYARIDIKSMRLCPLAVPEPGGLFAEMLLWEDGDDHV